ncbi:MAG TPA: hypothetical protein P5234_01630 [Thermoanaerobaculaceae bacterium]|nr:hypothetical protein [Thermoanaerobaculaceae bacterium]HRS14927.1 hypothetical protein [Thermoanaerobaculaceae bacterium]
METGRLVVVSCSGPREKFWGVLQALTPVGATLRVVPLEAFEDFLRQFREGGQVLIAPVTVFLPAHRLERIELDESGGAVEGLGDRFRRLAGRDPLNVLLGLGEPVPSEPRM